MTQNLISATLKAEDAADILKNLASAKSKLNFLSNLQKEDVVSLYKLGNALLPFVDLAHEALTAHPEIFPPTFDKEEFLRDYNLLNALRPIVSQIHELAESIQKTYVAVGSDTLAESRDIYDYVKHNKDKVPGLSVIADKMAAFFKKSKAKIAPENKKV